MSDKIFVDTNLWIYLYANGSDKEKTKTIRASLTNILKISP